MKEELAKLYETHNLRDDANINFNPKYGFCCKYYHQYEGTTSTDWHDTAEKAVIDAVENCYMRKSGKMGF